MKQLIVFFISLSASLIASQYSSAQQSIMQRLEVLTGLRQPFGETQMHYDDGRTPDVRHLKIGFDQHHFEYRGIDTFQMLDLLSDLVWNYVLGDSARYIDSTFIGVLPDSLPGGGYLVHYYVKAGNEVIKKNIHKRSAVISAILGVDNVINVFPSDEPGVEDMEWMLYINTSLFTPRTYGRYARLLPYLIYDYLLERDTKQFRYLNIKVIGEGNQLLDRFIFKVKDLPRQLHLLKN